MAEPRCTAIVPTLGTSPFLAACLRALRHDGGADLSIVVVDQGATPDARLAEADHVVRCAPCGFAAANNRAMAAARTPWVATVNDDALVDEGWLHALTATLDAHPEAAAAQGTTRSLDDPARLDGRGLAWNRRWQAIQLGHGARTVTADGARKPTERDAADSVEVFGVSATVALYRRDALAQVSPGSTADRLGPVFDPRLVAYYEDVDLACRLRAAGWTARHVPGAGARHAGSVTAGRGALPFVYGNRLLVLARVLGRSFWPRLPAFLLRDAIDGARAIARGDGARAGSILPGWRRALVRLPRFAHVGPAPSAPRTLQALSRDPHDGR